MIENSYSPRTHIWANEFHANASYRTWRSRGSPDYLLIYTAGGSGKVHSEGPNVTTHRGDIILFEPHALQSYHTNPKHGKWHVLWAHFQPRPHWKPWMNFSQPENGLLQCRLQKMSLQKKFQENMGQCVYYCQQRFFEMAMAALEIALIWAYSENSYHISDSRIQKAVDCLTKQLQQPFSLSALARQCGLSVSRLSHLFRQQVGMAPHHYLEELRLQQATLYLLNGDDSISEIAAATGYANVFYFSNRFKKRFGSSPTVYRTQNRKRGNQP